MTNVSFSIHLRVSAYDNKKHSTASDFWQVFMYFFAVNVTECQNRRVALYCFIGGKMSKSISGKVLLCYLTACPLTICPPVKKDKFPTHYVAIFFTAPKKRHREVESWPLSKLRFESPSSTSRELSSPIFQSLPVRDRCHLTRSLFVSIQALLVISTIKKEPVLFYTALHGSCRPV